MAAHAVSCRLRGARPRFLVLLCERSSLLVLLMFLQEETKLHSPLTCVDLKSNKIHLLLMKTMTLDRVGGPRGKCRGAVPGLRQTRPLIVRLLPLPPGCTARRSPRRRCLRTCAPCLRRSWTGECIAGKPVVTVPCCRTSVGRWSPSVPCARRPRLACELGRVRYGGQPWLLGRGGRTRAPAARVPATFWLHVAQADNGRWLLFPWGFTPEFSGGLLRMLRC